MVLPNPAGNFDSIEFGHGSINSDRILENGQLIALNFGDSAFYLSGSLLLEGQLLGDGKSKWRARKRWSLETV